MLSIEMRQVVSRSLSIRSRGKDFLTYVENTYLKENCRFPKEMWNHFDNHHERTNNHVQFQLQMKFSVVHLKPV